jgi:hypothetical protein
VMRDAVEFHFPELASEMLDGQPKY